MSNSKFSPLIRAGAIVHTVNGGVYRCTSKIASNDGVVKFRLADLQGKPVPTPADFRPISPALARLAAWMRLAYNKDFDLYVKEYIKAAGLPVDPAMNWSRFFAARIAPKLMSKDPEVQDEAIHQIIIKTLVERSALANFQEAIKKFPERIQELPLDKQVTTFLMQTFNWRLREANDYIKNFIFQDETSSMWAEGDAEDSDVNILDNAESTIGGNAYDAVDADVDVAHFRKGFEKFLDEKFRTETVEQYLALFDLIYAHLKEGEVPGSGATVRTAPAGVRENERGEAEAITKEIPTLFSEWKELTNSNKSHSWFKVLFTNLPKIIDTYITKHLNSEEVSPFVDIMRQIGISQKEQAPELQPIMGGLKLADEQYPINQNVEPDSPSSNNSGSSGFGSLPSLGDAAGEAGGEAASLGGELAELAPLAIAASKNAAQWEVPKCKGCGRSDSVTDCLACHEKFCNDCKLTHHANNPSHDRVASRKAALCNEKGCSGSKPGEPYCDACDRCEKHCKCMKKGSKYHYINGSQHKVGGCNICKKAEEQPHIGLTPPEMQGFIADCIGSGLYEQVGEPYFSWQGCDYCKGGGGNVTDYKGYRNLEDAQAPNREELEYEFQLCDDCLYKLVYGEE